MALIKFQTTDAAESDIIVDINVPVTLSLVAVDRGTIASSDATGATTLLIEWGTNWDSIAEAAVADPYHIPVLSEICKPGGYLEPDECKSFTSYTYS